jgi:hypothetical protein
MSWDKTVPFAGLKGKTIDKIDNDGERIIFHCSDGVTYNMFHVQDCCESVRVEEIIGDLEDVTGVEILLAEEVREADGPEPEYADHYTWTFYKLASLKGYATIRWLGESNGYYSESVDFVKT